MAFGSLKTRLIVLVGMLVGLSLVGSSGIIYLNSLENLEAMLGKRALAIARTTARAINVTDHEKVLQTLLTDYTKVTATEEHRRIQQTLREIQQSNGLKTEIYTYIKPHWVPNKLMFLVRGQNDFQMSGIDLEPYLQDAFKGSGKEGFTGIFSNLDGSWITGYAPLLKKDGTVSGIVEVALHTQDEVREVKNGFLSNIGFSVTIALLLAFIATILVANSIARPIAGLAGVVSRMGAGDLKIRAEDQKRRDEIGTLTTNFNQMASSLEETYAQLEEHNKNLEATVAERTKDLEKEKRNIETILNNIHQGIFTINTDATVNPVHSAEAEKIFGIRDFTGTTLAALFRLPGKKVQSFRDWLRLMSQPARLRRWHKFARLAPVKELTLKEEDDTDKLIQISYQPLLEEDKLDKVMILARDITTERQAEENARLSEQSRAHQSQALLGILNGDADDLQTFLNDARQGLDRAQDLTDFNRLQEQQAEIFRDMHSLKGVAGSFGFDVLARAAGVAEDYLAAIRDGEEGTEDGFADWTDVLAEISHLLGDIADLRQRMGQGQAHQMTIDRRRYEEAMVRLKAIDAEAAGILDDLESLPLAEACRKLIHIVDGYRQNSDKPIEPLIILNPDDLIHRRTLAAFDKALVHLIRNALDHGIESADTRQQRSKGPGKISIAFQTDAGGSRMVVSDDGGGIDPQQVADRAISKGLISAEEARSLTDTARQELIFLPGFSSKDDVSSISGRGLGMDIVREEARSRGGDVTLQSAPGEGTRVEISIPAAHFSSSGQAA